MSAAVGLPIILVNVWFGQIWLTIFVSIIGCVGLLELYRLFERLGKYPYKILGLLWTCWFVMNAHFEAIMPIWVLVVGFAILLIFCCLGISLRLMFKPDINIRMTPIDMIQGAVLTLLGVLYLGWTLSLVITLRQGPSGFEWVTLALICTFSVDTGALLIGKSLGVHKMIPSVSGGKTWEGAIGGFLFGVAATVILVSIFQLPVGYWQAFILGTIIGTSAQVGDLIESKLKRIASVKDSSNMIPGHGGILDRLDSVVFVFFVVYAFSRWLVY